jgi:MYXO-CTERM domain-containing protein
MIRRLMLVALIAQGCGPEFLGDARQLGFVSSRPWQYQTWNPSIPIAVGSELTISVHQVPCFPRACAPLTERAEVVDAADAGAIRALGRETASRVTVRAVAEGEVSISWSGTLSDSFTIRSRAVDAVALSDPLLFNRAIWEPNLQDFDGGTWPDLVDELVVGPRANLYLESFVRDARGALLVSSPELLDVAVGGDAGWSVTRAGSSIDVHTPVSGEATLELSYADAGVSRRYRARVAGREEAATLSLLIGTFGGNRIVKAVVTTRDGQPFFEPEIEWNADPDWREFDLSKQTTIQLRPRRDVKLFTRVFAPSDGGLLRGRITARLGTLEASLEEPVRTLPGAHTEAAAFARGCGCREAEGSPFVFLALVGVWAMRRRRAALLNHLES